MGDRYSEDTGEVVINGRLGAFRAWLKWLHPILGGVASSLIVAVTLWFLPTLIRHRDNHLAQAVLNESVQEFMTASQEFMTASKGNRVYSSSGEPVSTSQLKREIVESVRATPRPQQAIWNDQIEKRLDRMEAKLDRLLDRD